MDTACVKCGGPLAEGWRWKTCLSCKEAKRLESLAERKEKRKPPSFAAKVDFPTEWPGEFIGLETEQECRFVYAFVQNGGNGASAAALSNECKADSAHARVAASRHLAKQRVTDAILVFSKVVLRQLAPIAVSSLKGILRNPEHADHLKAIRVVLERTDQVVQRSELDITHKLTADDQALALLRYLLGVGAGEAALQAAFGASLPRYMALLEPPKVIEHDSLAIT